MIGKTSKRNYRRATICCDGCKSCKYTENLVAHCSVDNDFVNPAFICEEYKPKDKQLKDKQKNTSHVKKCTSCGSTNLNYVSLFDDGGTIDCVMCECGACYNITELKERTFMYVDKDRLLPWIDKEIKEYEDNIQFRYRVEVLEEIKENIIMGLYDWQPSE